MSVSMTFDAHTEYYIKYIVGAYTPTKFRESAKCI